jgi:hypothetical protein
MFSSEEKLKVPIVSIVLPEGLAVIAEDDEHRILSGRVRAAPRAKRSDSST